MELAQRHNKDKIEWSLVDYDALEDMVKVLSFGAKKYSANNWQKGLAVRSITDSLMRHMTAYLSGEDNDPESGLPNTGHILCNAMFLAHMHKLRPDMDNRFKSNTVTHDENSTETKRLLLKEEGKEKIISLATQVADGFKTFADKVNESIPEVKLNLSEKGKARFNRNKGIVSGDDQPVLPE